MKKLLVVVASIFLLQASCMQALTPPATPGENLWDLVARIGEELDGELEAENSQLEVIESKVDDVDAGINLLASCCDLTSGTLPGVISTGGVLSSKAAFQNALLDSIENVDLVRIESKIDNVAAATDLSVHDEFVATWTLIDAVESHVAVVESKVDALDNQLPPLASLVDVVHQSSIPFVESKVDALDSVVEELASCCDDIKNVILPRIESKIDDIDSEIDAVAANVSVIDTITLPRIESKIDAIDTDISVIDSMANLSESFINVIESKIDLLGVPVAAPCGGIAITQSDFVSGSLTITGNQYYCLAEDVTGRLTINGTDLTLDLNGHTITATNDAIAVSALSTRVVIRNGRLKNSGAILELMNISGDDIIVEDVVLSPSADGVYVPPTANNVIMRRCSINATGVGGAGILIEDCSNIQLLDSSITSQTVAVRVIGGVAPNTILIKNCTVRGVASSGIRVDIGAEIQIIDSVISRCGLQGIFINGPAGLINKVLIKNCIVESNGSVAGIFAQQTNNLTVEDCTIVGNTGAGISMNTVSNTHIINNSIRNNTGIGVAVTGTLGTSSVGAIEYNAIVGNTGAGISLAEGVINYSVEKNDVVNNGAPNVNFNVTAPQFNTIVANKAHTTNADIGTGFNYADQTTIPVLEWDRSAATLTIVSGGGAVTNWHNWSSVA